MITFVAELIKLEAKKTVSNDTEYRMVLVTHDPQSLRLIPFINERPLSVSVEENEASST